MGTLKSPPSPSSIRISLYFIVVNLRLHLAHKASLIMKAVKVSPSTTSRKCPDARQVPDPFRLWSMITWPAARPSATVFFLFIYFLFVKFTAFSRGFRSQTTESHFYNNTCTHIICNTNCDYKKNSLRGIWMIFFSKRVLENLSMTTGSRKKWQDSSVTTCFVTLEPTKGG